MNTSVRVPLHRSVRRCLFLATGLSACALTRADAQNDSIAIQPSSAPRSRPARPVLAKSDLRLAEGFALGAAVAFPFDEQIARFIRQSPTQQSAPLRDASTRINGMALPGGYIAGYALYGFGALTASEPILSAGFHSIAAVVVASHVGDAIKAAVGRSRPSQSNDAEQFAFGTGFSNAGQYSFPSGHATVAFALATAVSEELDARGHSLVIAAPALYGAATLVGLSRMYGEAHWASDVIAGAAVGTFTARLLVREAYAHPGNLFDAAAVHAVMTVDQNGRALLGWHSQP